MTGVPAGHGLVVGKFLPPHRGHHLLVDEAAARCHELVVVVSARTEEPIPLDLRLGWLADRHPQVRLTGFVDDHPVDFDSAEAWAYWADRFRRAWRAGTAARATLDAPDVLFSSEPYGEELAARIGCAHAAVDPDRAALPVSGTMVRDDPLAARHFLEPTVRAYFVKRVAVSGVAGAARRGLAAAVAAELDTAPVDLDRRGATALDDAARAADRAVVGEGTEAAVAAAGPWDLVLSAERPRSASAVRAAVQAVLAAPWPGRTYRPHEPGDRSRRFVTAPPPADPA